MGTATTDTLAQALRRIDKLERARRRVTKSLNRCTPGSELSKELARQRGELDEQIARWRRFVQRAEAEGLKVWSRADFARGDLVEYQGAWYPVLRVNARSLTVPHPADAAGERPPRTRTIGYHDGITGRTCGERKDLHKIQRPEDHPE